MDHNPFAECQDSKGKGHSIQTSDVVDTKPGSLCSFNAIPFCPLISEGFFFIKQLSQPLVQFNELTPNSIVMVQMQCRLLFQLASITTTWNIPNRNCSMNLSLLLVKWVLFLLLLFFHCRRNPWTSTIYSSSTKWTGDGWCILWKFDCQWVWLLAN